jgi:hypothetical protein
MIGGFLGNIMSFVGGASLPPFPDNALLILSGVVEEDGGNFYLSDTSGNDRRFLITGYDNWIGRGLIGFPYKTETTISAPIGDAILIAGDVNNFLYDSGGNPNEIPVVSCSPNIDYENKLYCQHFAQRVDENGIETHEPTVMNIVLYDIPLSGDALPIADAFYGVPEEQTSNVQWVTKDGNDTTGTGTKVNPYLTIQKAQDVASSGDTIYVKTGDYSETNSQGGLYLIGTSKTITCLGGVKLIPNGSGSVGLYINSANPMVVEGLNLTNTTKSITVRTRGDGNHQFNRCRIDSDDSGVGIFSNDTGDSRTLTNSIIIGSIDSSSNFTLDTCYANRITADYMWQIRAGVVNFVAKNSLIPRTDSIEIAKTWGDDIGLEFIGCNISGGLFTSTGNQNVVNIEKNTIHILDANEPVNFDNGIHLATVEGNAFIDDAGAILDDCRIVRMNGTMGNSSIANNTVSSSRNVTITVQSSTGNETVDIYGNKLISTLGFATITIGAVSASAYNNLLSGFIYSQIKHFPAGRTGLVYRKYNNGLYSENKCSLSVGDLDGTGNGYAVCELYNNNAESILVDDDAHCIFIQDVRNAKVSRNRVVNMGLGLVVKGFGDAFTVDVLDNVFEGCTKAITNKGASNVRYYGNTIDGCTQGLSIVVNDDTVDNWPSNDVVLRNNIIDACDTGIVYDAVGCSGLDSDHNIIHTDIIAIVSGVQKTWTEWQALGFDANGLDSDPLLTNGIPASNSPALGAGENLGNDYRLGLDSTTDWGDEDAIPDVVTRHQGNDWDCGAFVNDNAEYTYVTDSEGVQIESNEKLLIQ